MGDSQETPGRAWRLFLVEDDRTLAFALASGLRKEGFEVTALESGPEALERIRREEPDLVILDVMLPGLSGFEVCRRLRHEGNAVPTIMLTARGTSEDRIRGLHLGADDYVVKPFSFEELLARAQAVLRRVHAPPPPRGTLVHRELEIDLATRQVRLRGAVVDLSRREYQLLLHLASRPGTTITRRELLEAVWGYSSTPLTRTVDMHIAKIRRKIEDDPRQPRYLQTVHREGYRFGDPDG
jgi:DNA-binding response OmpR family regulator